MSRKKKTPAPQPAANPTPLASRGCANQPGPTPEPDDTAGLDREIAILRDLIRQAAEKQTPDLNLEDQLELLDKVGKAAPALARLLKARRDLANQELDPAAMLRQALLELEEEWPELKRFGEQFDSREQRIEAGNLEFRFSISLPHYKWLLSSPERFARYASGLTLRVYQQGVISAIFNSVLNQLGLTYVVIFPRQSGKNELQAQLETYLLTLFSNYRVQMVKVSPTLQPQALTAMRRLEDTVNKNTLTRRIWVKEPGSIYRVGQARIAFLSGAPESNIVGATASTLLEVDEAQDVLEVKYEKDVAPMCASTNATRVFWGTSWTSQTLLAKQLRKAQADQKKDGIRRVFKLTAEDVAAEVEAYRRHVEETVEQLGRTHPFVRTQYFSEEVDGEGGMFPPERIARLRTVMSAESEPRPGALYALLLDVAGEDEGVRGIDGALSPANPARDASALTLVRISRREEGAGLPVYVVVRRWQWLGEKHTHLHNQVRDIAIAWNARTVVVDATGVGAGLTSFLEKSLPGRVIPFTFNSMSKSRLGWDFLGIVDSERWREPAFDERLQPEQSAHQQAFFGQLAACQYQISAGPDQRMQWGVPDGTRHPQSGAALHDDWVLSAALVSQLEDMDWNPSAPALVVPGEDPLNSMDKGF